MDYRNLRPEAWVWVMDMYNKVSRLQDPLHRSSYELMMVEAARRCDTFFTMRGRQIPHHQG